MADRMDSLMLRTLADMTDTDLDRVAELMMKVMPDVVGHVATESGLQRIERWNALKKNREEGA